MYFDWTIFKLRVKQEYNMKKSNIKKRPVFQPVVLDDKGNIRSRFNTLYMKTRIEKRALASKIFDVGMKILEKTSDEHE